ncbi:hypothetical protein ACFWFZ_05055 [Streptomyces sp. NPDC060232]|uniref:hypothetical protein n=1 Tax=Streptomyces sp. NPDC060232 TaxID=3347079 RepID=UPI003659FBFC
MDGRVGTTEVKTVRMPRSRPERYALGSGDRAWSGGKTIWFEPKAGRGGPDAPPPPAAAALAA